MTTDEIIDILQDTLHYPELANAYDKLDSFRKEELHSLIYDSVNCAIDLALGEQKASFDDGFKKGQAELADEIIQRLQKKIGV